VDNAQYGGGHASTPAIPSEAVCRWHKEMAACLKGIDPYRHLVSASISHREVKGMYELDELDINQMHVYRNTAKMPGIIERNTELYGKPFVIGEFAWDWDWRNVWHSVGFAFDFELRRGLWEGLFTATPILPMSWWWEFLDQREMEWIFKPVREISDRMLSESKGDIVKINSITSHKDLTVSAIKAAESLYVYAVNPTYNRVGSSEIVFENLDFEGENFKVERYDMRTQRAEIMNMTLHSEGNKSVLSPVAVTPWDDRLYIITPVPKGWKPLNAVEEIEPF
jgi:hypothetical protein